MQLVPRADGTGMIAAVEILRKNPRVSKLISDGKTAEIHEEMERSVSFEKMQTMNQSLVALVLNGVITRQEALENSPTPGEFIHELRSFLQDVTRSPASGENDMADSPADFSKILELREVRRLYEETQERMRQEVAERDHHIESLKSQISSQDRTDVSSSMRALEEERDKLAHQLSFQKQDYESKIEKLQHRIKELSSQASEPSWSGIFRR